MSQYFSMLVALLRCTSIILQKKEQAGWKIKDNPFARGNFRCNACLKNINSFSQLLYSLIPSLKFKKEKHDRRFATLGGIASICFKPLRMQTQKCEGCQMVRNFVRISKILIARWGRPSSQNWVKSKTIKKYIKIPSKIGGKINLQFKNYHVNSLLKVMYRPVS